MLQRTNHLLIKIYKILSKTDNIPPCKMFNHAPQETDRTD